MIANIGDTIQWTFDNSDNLPKYLQGKTYTAKVELVDYEEKHYGVYTDYGQDYIEFDQCEILNDNHINSSNEFNGFM